MDGSNSTPPPPPPPLLPNSQSPPPPPPDVDASSPPRIVVGDSDGDGAAVIDGVSSTEQTQPQQQPESDLTALLPEQDKRRGDQMLAMEFELLGALQTATVPDDSGTPRSSLVVKERQHRISARSASRAAMVAAHDAPNGDVESLPGRADFVIPAEEMKYFGKGSLRERASARLYGAWSRGTSKFSGKSLSPQARRRRLFIWLTLAVLVLGCVTTFLLLTLLECSALGCDLHNVGIDLDKHVFLSAAAANSTTEVAHLSAAELADYPRLREMTDYLLSTVPLSKRRYADQVRFLNVTRMHQDEIPVIPFAYSLATGTTGAAKKITKPDGYLTVGTPFCARLSARNPVFGMWPANEVPTTARRNALNSMESSIHISNYTDTENHYNATAEAQDPRTEATMDQLPYCCMEFFALGFNDFKRVRREDVNGRLYCKTDSAGGVWAGWNDMVNWDLVSAARAHPPTVTNSSNAAIRRKPSGGNWVSQVQTGLSLNQQFHSQPDSYETVAAFFTERIGHIGPGVLLKSQVLVPMDIFEFQRTISADPDAMGVRVEMNAFIPSSVDRLSKLEVDSATFSLDYSVVDVDTSRLLPSPWPALKSVMTVSDNSSPSDVMQLLIDGPVYRGRYDIKLGGKVVTFTDAGCPERYSKSGTFCISDALTAADLSLSVQKTKSKLALPNESSLSEVVVTRVRPMFNHVPLVWDNRVEMRPFGIPNLPLQIDFVLQDATEDSSLSRWQNRNKNGRVFVMRDGPSLHTPESTGIVSLAETGGDWWEVETGMRAHAYSSSRTGELVLAYLPPTDMPNCLLVRIGLSVPDSRLSVRDFCLGALEWVPNPGSQNMTTIQTEMPDVFSDPPKSYGARAYSWSDVLLYQSYLKRVFNKALHVGAALQNSSALAVSGLVSLHNSALPPYGAFSTVNSSSFHPLDMYVESLMLSGVPADFVKEPQARSLTLFELPLGASEKDMTGQAGSNVFLDTVTLADDTRMVQLRGSLDPSLRNLITFFNTTYLAVDGKTVAEYLSAQARELFVARSNGMSMADLIKKAAVIMKTVGKLSAPYQNATRPMQQSVPQFLNLFAEWHESASSVAAASIPKTWSNLQSTLKSEDKKNVDGLAKEMNPVDVLTTMMAIEVSQRMDPVTVVGEMDFRTQSSLFLNVGKDKESGMNAVTWTDIVSDNSTIGQKRRQELDAMQICRNGRSNSCSSWNESSVAFVLEVESRVRDFTSRLLARNAPRKQLPYEIDILVDVADDSQDSGIRSLIDRLLERKKIVRSAWMTALYMEMMQEVVDVSAKSRLFYGDAALGGDYTGVRYSPATLRMMATFTHLSLLRLKGLVSLSGQQFAMWKAMDIATAHTDITGFLQQMIDIYTAA